MSQIAAVEAALKASGEKIGRPWSEWYRDDKGDETYFFHDDQPLICVVMDEEVLGVLTEDDAEKLAEGSALDVGDLCSEEPSHLVEIYARPMPHHRGRLGPG